VRRDHRSAEELYVWAAAGAGPGDDRAQVVDAWRDGHPVDSGHAHPALESRVIGEEAGDRSAGTREYLDVRAAPGPGPGYDLRLAVGDDVRAGEEHAAGEGRIVGHELGDQGARLAVEHLDVRPAARAGGGDDVGHAVAVHVPGGDADAAAEAGVVGQDRAHEVGAAIVDVDHGRPARAGPDGRGRHAGAGQNHVVAVAAVVADPQGHHPRMGENQ